MFSLFTELFNEPGSKQKSYSDIMAMNALDGHPFVDPGTCSGSKCTGGGAHEEGARKMKSSGVRSAKALMQKIDSGK